MKMFLGFCWAFLFLFVGLLRVFFWLLFFVFVCFFVGFFGCVLLSFILFFRIIKILLLAINYAIADRYSDFTEYYVDLPEKNVL